MRVDGLASHPALGRLTVSLYGLQKTLYRLNRDPRLRAEFLSRSTLPDGCELSDEERGALLNRDVGLLYVLGVNGQILMHFAAFCGVEWSRYLEDMREGVRRHGPVRAGVYAMTTRPDERVAGL